MDSEDVDMVGVDVGDVLIEILPDDDDNGVDDDVDADDERLLTGTEGLLDAAYLIAWNEALCRIP